jgi:hypothetical protein
MVKPQADENWLWGFFIADACGLEVGKSMEVERSK